MTTIMKLIKGLAYAAVALLTLASCNEKYDEWNPGEADTGSQFYFSNTTATTVTLTPASTSIDIPLYRVDTSSSSAAVVSVSEEETALVIASSPATFNVSFDAGSNVANLSIPVDMSKIDFGKSAKLNLTITGETTQYAASTLSVTATLPEPWKSLGNATVYDRWLLNWLDDPDGAYPNGFSVSVPLEQNEINPSQFRLTNPWGKIMSTLKYSDANAEPTDDYVVFEILKPGDVVGTVEITRSDLVYYDPICTGFYDSGNGGTHYYLHPSNFTSTRSEEGYSHNYISLMQDDGKLPAVIILSPFPYMYGVGGWNRSTAEEISIVFPGVVLKDYSIGLTVEGILTDTEGVDNALVTVDYEGADAKDVAVVLVPGGGEDAIDYALDLVFVEDESVVVINQPGMVKLPFGEDNGKYTVVAVPLDEEGNMVEKSAVYETIQYGLTAFQVDYTEDDLVAGVPKSTLLGTQWIVWGTDDESTAADREPYDIVTFEEAEDGQIGGDDCDFVTASGFDYGGGAYYGFDGTLTMEWYNGVIYTIGNEEKGTAYGYTVKPAVRDYAAGIYSTGNYGMMAAYVDDGLVAFVNNSSYYNYTAIEFAAFDSEGAYQGWFTCLNYILLADPAIHPVNEGADRAIKQARAKLQAKQYQLYKGSEPRNYVELPKTVSKKKVAKAPVVASGSVLSVRRIANPKADSLK